MGTPTCPLTAGEILDRYFPAARAQLLEIAAFLDRVDRAGDPEAGRGDFRYRAFERALRLLLDAPGNRAEVLLTSLSDPTEQPRASAAGDKAAVGAWKGGDG